MQHFPNHNNLNNQITDIKSLIIKDLCPFVILIFELFFKIYGHFIFSRPYTCKKNAMHFWKNTLALFCIHMWKCYASRKFILLYTFNSLCHYNILSEDRILQQQYTSHKYTVPSSKQKCTQGVCKKLTAMIIVARVQPGTSKGITDLLLPQPSSGLRK